MTARRHPRRAAVVLALAAAALTACAEQPDSTPSAVPPTAPADGLPLPAGARVEQPGAHPARLQHTGELSDTPAPDARAPEQRVPGIVERGRLVVGVDRSLYLLSFRDPETGQLRGFEVDLAREVARDIFGDPDRVEFRFLDSSQRRRALREGRVDMVLRATSITAERQRDLAFSAPYLRAHARLLAVDGSGIAGPEDLSGRTVCVTDGSTGLEQARDKARDATLLKTRNWSDCLVALQQDQADAILADDTMLSGIAAQDSFTGLVGEPLTEEYYGAAVLRPDRVAALAAGAGSDPRRAVRTAADAEGLLTQINATWARTAADGTWQAIFDRWFSGYLPAQTPPAPQYRKETP